MYIKTNNGAVETYPYSIGHLRKDNPKVAFPKSPSAQVLAEWGVYPVTQVDRPQIDHTKNISEGDPVHVNGAWLQNWIVTDASAEEIAEREASAWSKLRAERDKRLAACDWVVTKAVEQNAADGLGIQVPMIWINYRQALRDLPANTTNPFTPVWPQEP